MTPQQLQEAGVLSMDKHGHMLLSVHVQPGAKTAGVMGIYGDRLKLRLAAPPVDGKANKALIDWVANHFSVSRSRVSLVRGHTSRQKTVKIAP